MEAISLRRFKRSDVEFAHESTRIEEWNCTTEDVERMFRYNPQGCFVAELEGKQAGHVFSVSYGKLGWIGFLIVRAEYRRRGVGTLLMKKAIDHLLSSGVESIRLEAVPAAAELYQKLGFADEYDSLRFSKINRKQLKAPSSTVELLKDGMIKEIARFDAEYFGANRIKVLTSLYQDSPETCFVSYAGSKTVGYVMCRRGENGYRVAPWVCNPENPQVARELLTKCMNIIDQNAKLYVGVPVVNKVAVEILREFGFEQLSKSIRMRFGKKLEDERIEGIFGIGGAEKG